MFRKVLTLAGLVLALFHAWLFAGQAWDGQLADLALVARWVVAGSLIWALWSLRRRGASLFWGRQAVAIWLLAALLHGPSVAERAGDPGFPAVPEAIAILAQVALGATIVVGLVLLFGVLAAARRRRPPVLSATRSDHALLGALSPDRYLLFAPRPPPLA